MVKSACACVDIAGMTVPADDGFDFFAPDLLAAKPDTAADSTVSAGRLGFTPPPRPQVSEPQPKPSRWAKSETTFGPVGRIVCTFALLLPFSFLVAAGLLTFDPFVLGGAGIWFVLMVMGLRQTWQLVHHHHRH